MPELGEVVKINGIVQAASLDDTGRKLFHVTIRFPNPDQKTRDAEPWITLARFIADENVLKQVVIS